MSRRLAGAVGVVGLQLLLHLPATAATVFGMVSTGELFASANGGAAWTVRSTLPVPDAVAMMAGANSTQLYLASRGGTFYRSTDAGVSWSAIGVVAAPDVAALIPFTGRMLLVSRTGSVFASLDAGLTFSGVGAIPAPDVVSGAQLGGFLFALTRSGEVFRSGDAGASWSAIGTLPVSNAVSIARFQNRLHVLTATGDLARSDDQGATWSFVSTLSQSGMTSLLAAAGELLASTGAGEVAASADGVSWTWRGSIDQVQVAALASDEPSPTAVGLPEAPARALFAPRPNPARVQTTLTFDLEGPERITVRVLDASGREVARPVADQLLPAGRVSRTWTPNGLACGLYFMSARIGGRLEVRRWVWLGGER